MEIFINGTGNISPQSSFDEITFSLDSMNAKSETRLKCIEPDYKNYLPPNTLRRMSRMIKMGITSAKICLANAGVEQPGAIITGTGLGCLEDTEKFIVSIVENNETLLTPTPFIQSTHNTVGGQIALMLSCHEYNSTYVHRGSSFEFALIDAAMLLNEGTADNVLVGGIDELTDTSFQLLRALDVYSKEETIASDLSNGTSGGEGAAFFLLSDKQKDKSLAKITLIKTYSGKIETEELSLKIKTVLAEANKLIEDIELVLLGNSGNTKTDTIYSNLKAGIFKKSKTQPFKQFCGEYHTASAFALWYATRLITEKSSNSPSSILIYNQFGGSDHNIILVEKC